METRGVLVPFGLEVAPEILSDLALTLALLVSSSVLESLESLEVAGFGTGFLSIVVFLAPDLAFLGSESLDESLEELDFLADFLKTLAKIYISFKL